MVRLGDNDFPSLVCFGRLNILGLLAELKIKGCSCLISFFWKWVAQLEQSSNCATHL